MIILIEPLCSEWEHEDVNAGLLKLIDSMTDEKITYYGDRGQIKAVSRIYHSAKVSFEAIKIPIKKIANCEKSFKTYLKMIGKIILDSRPDTIFITSGTISCMKVVSILAQVNPQINIIMALHGILDPKLGDTGSCIKIMKKASKSKNLKWIVYSYSAQKLLEYNNIKNGIFLHLTYISTDKRNVFFRHDKYRIGIIGACANENAVRLVAAAERTKDVMEKYEFWVLSKNSNMFHGYQNVQVLQSGFTRNYKEAFMQQIDYMLLPYGRNEYRAATSGVLMDAISNRIPCLSYDSPCISYYQKRYNIGIQAASLNEMLEVLRKNIYDVIEMKKYFVNIGDIEKENQTAIKKILTGGV